MPRYSLDALVDFACINIAIRTRIKSKGENREPLRGKCVNCTQYGLQKVTPNMGTCHETGGFNGHAFSNTKVLF